MEGQTSRRILMIGGWVIAALVVILYLGSRYEFTLRKKATNGPSSPTPSFKQQSPRQPAPVQAQVRELSAEELFQRAAPSVVLVEVFDDRGHKRGLGSGFIGSDDGAIITNYHVIRGAYRAVARFADGTQAPISGVLGYDADRDVAVLRARGRLPNALKLGDSDRLRAGQKVAAIGSPLGFQNTVTEGIVSGIRLGLIQMSAPISPGSSGGPVLTARGEVVGVAVASAVGGQNLNFAVPVNWAKAYVGGNVERPLAEILRENTIVDRILDGEVSIPAGKARSWEIQVDPNLMSNAELRASVHSEGGLTGNIRIVLLRGERVLHDSGRVQRDDFHAPLDEGGSYNLVLDNSGSMMFARKVSGRIELRYVK